MRPAIEIARTLPALTGLSDEQVALIVDRRDWRTVLGYYPSLGEVAVLDFARAAEILLERGDAETVDAVLQLLDRVRAWMRP